MCVAVVKPKGIRVPTKHELRNCFRQNYDGAGFAWWDKENALARWEKGFMSFRHFWRQFKKRKFTEEDKLLIHFRITSHGETCKNNTHPFPLSRSFEAMRKLEGGTIGRLMIHNGIIEIDRDTDEISDTMQFASVLSRLDTNHPSVRRLISMSIGHSKIAIMDARNGRISTFGKWHNHEGVYYSNTSYKDVKYISQYNYAPLWDDSYAGYRRVQKKQCHHVRSFSNPQNAFTTGNNNRTARALICQTTVAVDSTRDYNCFAQNICPRCLHITEVINSYRKYCSRCDIVLQNNHAFEPQLD